jgi:hypothetical protein
MGVHWHQVVVSPLGLPAVRAINAGAGQQQRVVELLLLVLVLVLVQAGPAEARQCLHIVMADGSQSGMNLPQLQERKTQLLLLQLVIDSPQLP